LAHTCKEYEKGRSSIGKISMVKAHITRVARDVTRTARELQGANGLLWENETLKQMIDMEGAHTGEGTYDVCVLVSARELTGYAAFK
jgi:alkylation response protein AidB-like acyl-CoA dehydrogenase